MQQRSRSTPSIHHRNSHKPQRQNADASAVQAINYLLTVSS